MNSQMIAIEDVNSSGIVREAKRAGITHIEYLGDNGKDGDARITVYALRDPATGDAVRVAHTNGDPVWEEEDVMLFADMLESEGIDA